MIPPQELIDRVGCMLRLLSGGESRWVPRSELAAALTADPVIRRELGVAVAGTDLTADDLAPTLVDRWSADVAAGIDLDAGYVDRQDSLEPAWRTHERPLPPLDDVLAHCAELLLAKGARPDGEAGGRFQFMWHDRPVFIGHDPTAPSWAAAEINMIAGLWLDPDPAIYDVVEQFRVHLPPTIEITVSEGIGVDVFVDRVIAQVETTVDRLPLVVDQLLSTGVALAQLLDRFPSSELDS